MCVYVYVFVYMYVYVHIQDLCGRPACFGGRRVVWGQCEVQTEEDVAELCVWPTIPNTTRAPHLRHTFHMRLLQVFEAAPQEARGAQAKRAAPDYFL